jgi:hypothetical protein
VMLHVTHLITRQVMSPVSSKLPYLQQFASENFSSLLKPSKSFIKEYMT